MQTKLAPELKGSLEGDTAEAILRQCVHCGFCNATCPTYQLSGDELEGPRGRIYLIKQTLEGAPVTRLTQQHLDHCLTCRNCETTCPSGVPYGQLIEIGRGLVEQKVARPPQEKLLRWALKEGLTSSAFAPAMKFAQWMQPLLPGVLKHKVPPPAPARAHEWPKSRHARKVLMLQGCVQPAMMPNINSATARVLDAAGIEALVAPQAGCCGALRTHLNDHAGGLDDMRRNIDAWWPLIQTQPLEAIVMNASGCGVTVKGYASALAHDAAYADKARCVSELSQDLGELLPGLVPTLKARLHKPPAQCLAYHPPCTLQHGQQKRGHIEAGLSALGWQVRLATSESHLCCGSAGTYSVLYPETAHALRDRKLAQLEPLKPEVIISANMGCIQHLQTGTAVPVRHWVEVLDDALTVPSSKLNTTSPKQLF